MFNTNTLSLATFLVVTLSPVIASACLNGMIIYTPSTEVWLFTGPVTLCLVWLFNKFVARWKRVAARYRIALIVAAMTIPNIIAMCSAKFFGWFGWIWLGMNTSGYVGALAFGVATGLALAKTEEQIANEHNRKVTNRLTIVIAVSVILSIAVTLEFAEPFAEPTPEKKNPNEVPSVVNF